MSLPIGVDKLLKKYKTIWVMIKELKNIELNALPVYNKIDVQKQKSQLMAIKIILVFIV